MHALRIVRTSLQPRTPGALRSEVKEEDRAQRGPGGT
jgi:hypothetical protein